MQSILFITTKSEVGGVQKFVKEQLQILQPHFKLYLVTNKHGWLTQQVQQWLHGSLLNTAIQFKFSPLFIYKLYRFIKANNISLVVCNSANAGFYGRIAAKLAGVNACYYSHGWSSLYNGGKLSWLLNRIEKWLSNITKIIICVSNNDAFVAQKIIGIEESKLTTIQNSVLPNYKIKSFINSLQPLHLMALCRFTNPKRIDLLIQSIASLPNVYLDVVGSGESLAYWQKAVQVKNIQHINLLGEVPSFNNFHHYDAFILLSDSEGLPLSAIEAMSAGLPLILSKVGGCPELINHNGVLVDNNTESIKHAIKVVARNIEAFSQASLHNYNAHFNLEYNQSKYILLYKNLLKGEQLSLQ